MFGKRALFAKNQRKNKTEVIKVHVDRIVHC